jgi:hypothetical protein
MTTATLAATGDGSVAGDSPTMAGVEAGCDTAPMALMTAAGGSHAEARGAGNESGRAAAGTGSGTALDAARMTDAGAGAGDDDTDAARTRVTISAISRLP